MQMAWEGKSKLCKYKTKCDKYKIEKEIIRKYNYFEVFHVEIIIKRLSK